MESGAFLEHGSLNISSANFANAMPVGLLVSDPTGLILFANTEIAHLTGYTVEDLFEHHVDIFATPGTRDVLGEAIRSYSACQTRPVTEDGRKLFVRRHDGTDVPIEIALRPVTFGSAAAVLVIVADRTAHYDAVDMLQAMFAASPNGLFLVDQEAKIVRVNHRVTTMFGYTEAELLGQSVEILLPNRLRAAHVTMRNSFIAAPEQRPMGAGRDVTGLRKDGVEFPVEIGLSAIESPKQMLTCAFVTDITESKRNELRLRETNAQLEEFTHVASHDLRSPIRGIANLIEFIQEDYGSEAPENIVRNLERMRVRVSTMERLIEDLLAYARAGKRTGRVEQVDLATIVDEVMQLEPFPENATIKLDIRMEPFQGARIPITTILRNLISNAVKHHHQPDAMTLTVRAFPDDTFCVFEVMDDGPGISAIHHERIFRLFQTLSSTDRKEGSGLGLAVVQRLVEGHGGLIEVISSGDSPGTTFSVRWPRFTRSDHAE